MITFFLFFEWLISLKTNSIGEFRLIYLNKQRVHGTKPIQKQKQKKQKKG